MAERSEVLFRAIRQLKLTVRALGKETVIEETQKIKRWTIADIAAAEIALIAIYDERAALAQTLAMALEALVKKFVCEDDVLPCQAEVMTCEDCRGLAEKAHVALAAAKEVGIVPEVKA